jgi:hypothetical protein
LPGTPLPVFGRGAGGEGQYKAGVGSATER